MIRFHLSSPLWLLATLLPVACPAAEDVPYSVGSWSDTLGNHRARIQVTEKADAVWVHLPWRRHDRDPEKKDILIVDAATGKTVENVARVRIGRESADLVFQPATVPGEYFVYYAPYTIQPGSGGYSGDYLPPKATAAPEWLKRHGLAAETDRRGGRAEVPAGQGARVPGPERVRAVRPDGGGGDPGRDEEASGRSPAAVPGLCRGSGASDPHGRRAAVAVDPQRAGPRTARPGGAERVLCLSDRRLCGEKGRSTESALEFTELRSPRAGSFRPRGSVAST